MHVAPEPAPMPLGVHNGRVVVQDHLRDRRADDPLGTCHNSASDGRPAGVQAVT